MSLIAYSCRAHVPRNVSAERVAIDGIVSDRARSLYVRCTHFTHDRCRRVLIGSATETAGQETGATSQVYANGDAAGSGVPRAG